VKGFVVSYDERCELVAYDITRDYDLFRVYPREMTTWNAPLYDQLELICDPRYNGQVVLSPTVKMPWTIKRGNENVFEIVDSTGRGVLDVYSMGRTPEIKRISEARLNQLFESYSCVS